MQLRLERKYRKDTYIIGNLYVDGKLFCNTIEDKDRGLTQTTPIAEIKAKKVYAQTAIPYGKYKVTIDVVSNKFSKKDFYLTYANKGRVPRLLNVPGFDGILIHCGSSEQSSAGCIIVGENKVKGKVINSQDTFKRLYKALQEGKKRGESITIDIVKV